MTWMSPKFKAFPLAMRYSNRLGGRMAILIYSSFSICFMTLVPSSCSRFSSIFRIRERLTRHVGSFVRKKNMLFDLYMYSILLTLIDSCMFIRDNACFNTNFFSSLLNFDY